MVAKMIGASARMQGHVTGVTSTPPRQFSPTQGIRRNSAAFANWVPTSAALPMLPLMLTDKKYDAGIGQSGGAGSFKTEQISVGNCVIRPKTSMPYSSTLCSR